MVTSFFKKNKKIETCFKKNSTFLCFDFAQNLLSGCVCNKLRETIENLFWSHHLHVIEKDTYILLWYFHGRPSIWSFYYSSCAGLL
jgi:hypothetical protein